MKRRLLAKAGVIALALVSLTGGGILAAEQTFPNSISIIGHCFSLPIAYLPIPIPRS